MQILLFFSSQCSDCTELGAYIDKYEDMSKNINFIPVDSGSVKNVIGGRIHHVPAVVFVENDRITNIIQDKLSVFNFIKKMSNDFKLIQTQTEPEEQKNDQTVEEVGKTSINNLFN